MRDLVIIGGGAASQAAAMYALGKQIDFLFICDQSEGRFTAESLADRDDLVHTTLAQADWPDVEAQERQLLGSSAVRLFGRRLSRQSEHLLNDRVVGIHRLGQRFIIETQCSGALNAGAVILATGAAAQRLGGIEGSHLVSPLGYHRSYHSNALTDKVVAVIGASEQAIYTAAEFARQARQVLLVLPYPDEAERLDVTMLQRQPNVELLSGFRLSAVQGTNAPEQLVVERDDERLTFGIDAVFADLGYEPASALVGHLVKTGPDGLIKVDRGFATVVPGLFAAGDVTSPGGEQVLSAIGDGTRAARSAHFYLLTRPVARGASHGR